MSEADGAPLVVAIDGPSGVGKSTAARALARRLGILYIDSGAMYRALALKTVKRGIDPTNETAVAKMVASSRVELRHDRDSGTRLILDGEEVDDSIRGPGVSAVASTIAMQPAVRERLVELQRRSASTGGVLEGRDIGTVVFPDTPHKFFLDASLSVRRERRLADRRRSDPTLSAETVEAEIELRDRRDRERSLSPLRSDSSYVVLDTSEMDPEEVVQRMVELVEGRGRNAE